MDDPFLERAAAQPVAWGDGLDAPELDLVGEVDGRSGGSE